MNQKQQKSFKSRFNGIPFSPSGSPLFYGWIILLAGTLGVIMSIPGQTMGVSVFTDSLIEVLNITRDQISFAYLAGTIISALLLRRAGRLYDRFGARIMASITALLLGFVLFIFSGIDSHARTMQGIFSDLPPYLVTMAIMIAGFFLLRFLGQGVLTMVSRNMVMKWFDHHRGLANGLMGVFVSFGFSYSPRAINQLIMSKGWQGAWLYMAAIIGLLFSVAVLVFFRDNPEECGLKPDGNLPPLKKNNSKPPATAEKDYTLGEARKTYAFWIFTLTLTMFSLFVTATTFHIVSIFKSAAMSREEAIAIFLPASVISVLFHLFGSWLSDYIRLKYVHITHALGLMFSMTALQFLAPQGFSLWLLILGNGIAGGTFGVLSSITWPRFYGLKHLGEIAGYSFAWAVAGSALGPYLFSISFSHLGSYRPAALLCLGITAILFLLSFKADNINKKKISD